MLLKNEQLAWAAGFFDGEGCISIAKKPGKYGEYRYPVILIAQKDKRVLEKFKNIVGVGKIIFIKDRPHATFKNSSIYHYCIYKVSDVKKVLEKLWPWLSDLKKEQAELALKQNTHRNKLHSHCKRGHKLEGNNVAYGSGRRWCRICKNKQQRENYAKRKKNMEKLELNTF